MRKTKYIVGKLNSSNCTTAVIFDELINHSDMRSHFSEIYGAGFCFILNGDGIPNVKVCGESYTLKVKSREEDVDIIKKTLGLINHDC